MPFDVKDKVAIVTGANRGIGKVITETLLERGAAKIYAAVRDPASATRLANAHPNRVVAIPLDLTKPETIEAAGKTAGDVQLVVNNGGILLTSPATNDNAVDNLKQEMDVNVYGLIRMAGTFGPILRKNGGGAFVQLNSVASLRCFAPFATNCASKAAAHSITQGLREDWKAQGTHVLSVHPGPIDTDMGDQAGFGDIAESPDLVADAIVRALAEGAFHVYPDSMAQQVGEAYSSFQTNVVEAEMNVS